MPNNVFFKNFIVIPSGVLLLIILVSVGLSYLLFDMKRELKKENVQLQSSAKDLIQKVQFLRRQQDLYHLYGKEYEDYIKEKKMVKGIDKVKWIDELFKIKQKLVAVPFVIQFEPERKIDKSFFSFYPLTRDIFYYTRMNLDASLQTDYDLIILNEMVTKNISPLFLLESCQIGMYKITFNNLAFNPEKGNVNVRCSFLVFQAKPRLLEEG